MRPGRSPTDFPLPGRHVFDRRKADRQDRPRTDLRSDPNLQFKIASSRGTHAFVLGPARINYDVFLPKLPSGSQTVAEEAGQVHHRKTLLWGVARRTSRSLRGLAALTNCLWAGSFDRCRVYLGLQGRFEVAADRLRYLARGAESRNIRSQSRSRSRPRAQ